MNEETKKARDNRISKYLKNIQAQKDAIADAKIKASFQDNYIPIVGEEVPDDIINIRNNPTELKAHRQQLAQEIASDRYSIPEKKKMYAEAKIADNLLNKGNIYKGRSLDRALQAARRVGGKALKAVPLIGPIAAAAASGDVSAAIPLLNEAEEVGAPTHDGTQPMPEYDFGEYNVKEGETDNEARARIAALQALKNR